MKTIIIVIVGLCLFGCENTSDVFVEKQTKSFDICIKKGGVPIISSWGPWMTDCKFPTVKKEVKDDKP